MPWNSQGGGPGGPWSSGPGPWGRGPQGGGGGGQTPPDIEEFVKRLQDKLRRGLPGGLGRKPGLSLVVLAVLLLWLASGFYTVNPDEVGMVQRFGQWVDTTPPGLRYHLPSPIETVVKPRVTVTNRIELGYRTVGEGRAARTSPTRDVPEEGRMLTGDENIVEVDFSVFWQIRDPGEFMFNIRDPEGTVKVVAESALREIIGQNPIEAALSAGKAPIEDRSRVLMQKLLDDYKAGVRIVQVQLQKVDPPPSVVDAFNDVQRAKADQERSRNEAEGYSNDIIPRARGDAVRIIQEAEAYKEQVLNLAQGEASRFLAVYAAYKQAEDVTARRLYIDAMEDILKGATKVLIDPSAKGAQGVLPYMALPDLKAKAAAAPAQGGQR